MQEKITTISERIFGNPGTMSSFRAEAGGVHHTVTRQPELPESLYGHNKAVINTIQEPSPLHTLTPEWDLLEPTRQVINKNGIKCKHVKSH